MREVAAPSGRSTQTRIPRTKKSESAQREAEENSGHGYFGARDHAGGAFHSNEDPTHEKTESAAREAEENAGQMPTAP